MAKSAKVLKKEKGKEHTKFYGGKRTIKRGASSFPFFHPVKSPL